MESKMAMIDGEEAAVKRLERLRLVLMGSAVVLVVLVILLAIADFG